MKDSAYQIERVHVLRLATGDDLYEALTAYAEENAIPAGWVNFLGAVRRASVRYYDQVHKCYCDFATDRRLEVLAGVGNISLLDDRPFLHIHAAFGLEDGRAWGGHVNVGTEVFALEASIWELSGEPLVREPDDCTGLTLWGGTLPAPPVGD